MAAIDQSPGQSLTIREAAAACGLSPRTIRRKLTADAFPNAFKLQPRDGETEGVWKIPVGDLEAAGLSPTLLHPTISNGSTQPEPTSDGPTVLELVRSDRFGRLRAELAEAVAAAEIALLRAEAERWRSLADERGDRARPGRHRAEGAHHRDELRDGREQRRGPHPDRSGPGARATSSRCPRSCGRRRCATPRPCRRSTICANSRIVGGSSGAASQARPPD